MIQILPFDSKKNKGSERMLWMFTTSLWIYSKSAFHGQFMLINFRVIAHEFYYSSMRPFLLQKLWFHLASKKCQIVIFFCKIFHFCQKSFFALKVAKKRRMLKKVSKTNWLLFSFHNQNHENFLRGLHTAAMSSLSLSDPQFIEVL